MSKKEPQILYHYCSLETFEKIIKNHTIRFSDITKSNDSDELIFICKLYWKFLNKKVKFNPLKFFIKESSQDLIHYAFCLSEKGDDLSQWRGYAPNGGVAIGFDTSFLKKMCDNIETTLIDEKHQFKGFDKIKYIDIKEKDKELRQNWEDIKNEFGKMPTYSQENFAIILNKLLELSNTYKNSAFKNECERRLYFCNYIGNDNTKIKYNNQYITQYMDMYYDIVFDFSMIKEIIIGPKVNFMGQTIGLNKLIYNFIKENDIYKNLKIKLKDVKLCN